MIKAEKNNLFIRLFHLYNRFLIGRSFHRLLLTKHSTLPSGEIGAIYLINHSSWWDSLILFYLNTSVFKMDAIAMMDEDGLKRFPFFRKIGAFSVDRHSAKSLVSSLKYASGELGSGKHLFMFPQGGEMHLEQRPYSFFQGAAYLHDLNPDLPVIPISFYHGFFHHQFPEWYIHVGEPLSFYNVSGRRAKTDFFEMEMERQVAGLKQLVMADKQEKFITLFKGRRGVGERWESLKKRIGSEHQT